MGNSFSRPRGPRGLALQFEVYDALYAWCRLQVAKDSK